MSVTNTSEPSQIAVFRKNVADTLSSTVPEVSAYFMMKANRYARDPPSDYANERNSCCPWCGSQISMENHKFRVIPKRKKSRRIHKLENKLRKGIHLPKNQRRHLLNFQSRTNHLRLSCKVCKKTFKYTGSMATLKGSKILKGGIRQLKTPENHPKQKSQMRHLSSFSVGTPSPSPAASTPSTPSTSSAKKQKQKWKHSRLQQILKTSKQQQSPSSVLQGFLSSI